MPRKYTNCEHRPDQKLTHKTERGERSENVS